MAPFIYDGILTSITYPTGAKTDLEYEMHDYASFSGGNLYKVTGIDTIQFDHTYTQDGFFEQSFVLSQDRFVRIGWQSPFSYTRIPWNYLRLYKDGGGSCGNDTLIYDFIEDGEQITRTLSSGTYHIVLSMYECSASDWDSDCAWPSTCPGSGNICYENLPALTNCPNIFPWDLNGQSASVTIYKWKTEENELVTAYKGGGIRIKEMKTFDKSSLYVVKRKWTK